MTGVRIACLVAIVAAAALAAHAWRPGAARRAARRTARRLPFLLTPTAYEELGSRVVGGLRMTAVVLATAGAVGLVASWLGAGVDAVPALLVFVVLVVTVHVLAPFHAAAELVLRRPGAVPVGLRVARGRVVRVSDFVKPRDLLTARLTWVSTVLLLATVTVGSVQEGRPLGDVATAGALGVVVLLGAACVEVAARITVTRPRPAASAQALMSDDAVTSSVLRTAFSALAGLAYFSTSVMVLSSTAEDGLPYPAAGVALLVLTSVAWMVGNLLSSFDASLLHFLVRLWDLPTRAPSPVPVPARPINPYRGGPS